MNIYEFIKEKISNKSIILEIGSHMGLDTKIIYDITKSNNIHCFEPDKRNIDIFKSFEINAIINEVAISNIDGEIDFYMSHGHPIIPTNIDILNNNDWSSSSSTKKPKLHLDETPWCKFSDPIKVKSMRIDTYCEKIGISHIDFVWMDVQGAEIDVLNSFGKYINETKYIYTEYSNKELYCGAPNKHDILNNLGSNWELIYDFGNDILLKNKIFI